MLTFSQCCNLQLDLCVPTLHTWYSAGFWQSNTVFSPLTSSQSVEHPANTFLNSLLLNSRTMPRAKFLSLSLLMLRLVRDVSPQGKPRTASTTHGSPCTTTKSASTQPSGAFLSRPAYMSRTKSRQSFLMDSRVIFVCLVPIWHSL